MKPQELKKLRNETKQFRGVSLDIVKVRKNAKAIFRARFSLNRRVYSLGYHETPVEAAKAVNKKAKMLFKTEKRAKKAGYWNII